MDLLQKLNLLISETEKLKREVDSNRAEELEQELLYLKEQILQNRKYDV